MRVLAAVVTVLCLTVAGCSGTEPAAVSSEPTSSASSASPSATDAPSTATTPTPEPTRTTLTPPPTTPTAEPTASEAATEPPAGAYADDPVGSYRNKQMRWKIHLEADGTFREDFEGFKNFRNGTWKQPRKTRIRLKGRDGVTTRARYDGATLTIRGRVLTRTGGR
ncbi:hypothetical protein CLV56_0641 [Mumia flava]|uniref:Lipoprotein n=1 Tax=Mumia flava TaxID=1348852 RepID=A0A0B2BLE7_9ACTN|nr:hypothetical protein [Mumia flava]PJJ56433.1 hypothetical protein CLV56_0641 [Mumia flava]